ncbi:Fic family protein [Kineosporia rhizophila]|uniref:Fic family protein n=1 Tax=Kineosporia rhizophila TaxID=84633 RepID=UPI000A869D2A
MDELGSPAVSHEERPWEPVENGMPLSRRARLASRGPYRAAVPAAIAHLDFALPGHVIAESTDALTEIARFDAELSLPGHGGEFVPLAAVLLRTESASSSQIENVTAGAKALALATLQEKAGANARLVAANVEAMSSAVDMAEDLSEQTLLAAHRVLMHGHADAQPGRFRDAQVWIGGSPFSPHTASFIPPHHDRLPAAMSDLMQFCERTDMPVLVHAALAHAQFETIHPFADGNGRVGRVPVHVMLKRAGATRRLTVPVSSGLLVDTAAYFDALTAFRAGDAAPIVQRFTEAAFAAVGNGRRLHRDILDCYEQWTQVVTARRDSAVWHVLPHLVSQPVVTAQFVQEAVGVSRTAALNAVNHLVKVVVLAPASAAQRDRVWVAGEIISALDEFAARASRGQVG